MSANLYNYTIVKAPLSQMHTHVHDFNHSNTFFCTHTHTTTTTILTTLSGIIILCHTFTLNQNHQAYHCTYEPPSESYSNQPKSQNLPSPS
mmetsp:Transcript_7297/g.10711  ORF Transcript_7297/g.10711 Transcript_7297/m.10711 type:complete len:91 (-) Transcript_7297:1795-2067(-)